MSGAVVAAVAAAALFAVATALQHRSAGLVTAAGGRAETGPAAFVSGTLRHPLWIAGSVASLAGLALHTLALKDGPLTLVQPLLVIGVIFTLPLRQLLEHRRPRPAELVWAAVLALGLAVFLVLSSPASQPAEAPDPGPAVVSVVTIGLIVSGCLIAGWRWPRVTPAMVLGAAAGLSFAATAGLMKQTMDAASQGGLALLTQWPVYALIAIGGAGHSQPACIPGGPLAGEPARGHDRQSRVQRAHRSGRLRRALPDGAGRPARGGSRPDADGRRHRRPDPDCRR